jgi:hypothetical protein
MTGIDPRNLETLVSIQDPLQAIPDDKRRERQSRRLVPAVDNIDKPGRRAGGWRLCGVFASFRDCDRPSVTVIRVIRIATDQSRL